jgi:aspartate/methionine/tyrosine aminotransferase
MFSQRTNWNLEHSRLSKALDDYRSSGRPLIDLTESNPTKCGFRLAEQQILSSLNHHESLSYDPLARGLLRARESVADYYRFHGSQVSVDDICLTTSTSEAYSFLFRMLCNPGDEVLIPQPGYPLFNFLADIQDVTPVRYPLLYDYGWQIDFHALQHAITPRTRGIVVVNPNNPTGHFCRPDDMDRLSQICSERGLPIIADEVFLDFYFGGETPQSFASNRKALTFTMSGLSKISGLPQMKVAWLVATGPEALKAQAVSRLEMIADTYLSMNTPIQLALDVLLGQRDSFRTQWLERAQKNLDHLDQLLSSQKLCARLSVEGGWYAVLKVPLTGSDEDLALDFLNAHGVYLHPGHFYDFPANGYVVVSLITAEPEFTAGIAALLTWVRDKCAPIPGS